MQAIKDAGIEVKTMRDALNEVMPQTGQDWAKLPSPTDLPADPGPIPGPIPGPNPNPPSDHVVVPPPAVTPPPPRDRDQGHGPSDDPDQRPDAPLVSPR